MRAAAAEKRPLGDLLTYISAFQPALSEAMRVRTGIQGFTDIGYSVDEKTDTVCLDPKSVFSMCPTYNRMTDCQAAAVIDSLPGVTETCARQGFLLEPNYPDTIPQVLESEKHRDELTLCRYFRLFTPTLIDGCIHPGNVQQLCPQKASCACTQTGYMQEWSERECKRKRRSVPQ